MAVWKIFKILLFVRKNWNSVQFFRVPDIIMFASTVGTSWLEKNILEETRMKDLRLLYNFELILQFRVTFHGPWFLLYDVYPCLF